MNVFRFCRWSLAALPVFFVFTACDKLLPTGGSGDLVQVKIRAVSVEGYGEASATRSAGGEKRIVGQPIIQDLGGGMLAEITVEEDVSALRDDSDPKDLDNGAKFRIIALNEGTSIIYSWADYTAASSGTLEPVAGNLHVVSGVKYDFVCYSYNTSDNLAGTLSEGSALGSITVTNANDFLYKKLTAQKLDATNNTLSFTLEQQLTKVNLTFAVSYSDWKITAVNSSPTLGTVTNPSAFTFSATTPLSGETAGTQSFTGFQMYSNATQASGSLRLVPVAESSAYTLTIPKQAVTLSGTSLQVASHPTDARTATITTKLEKGSSYTVTVKLKELGTSTKFAGSNIYWDDSDQDVSKHKLTFKPYNKDNTTPNPETYYQGVLFKWGSLIGISPARTSSSTDFSSGTTDNEGKNDGTPIYMTKDSDGNWVKTNVAHAISQNWISGSGWSAIPSYDGETFSSNLSGDNAYSLLAKSGAASYLGDICNYINPAYRMPTRNELNALHNSDYENYTSFTSSDITGQAANGMTAFTAQYGAFAGIPGSTYHLPASGYRYYNSGALNYVGNYAYYWSGSSTGGDDDNGNNDRAYYLDFDHSGSGADPDTSDAYRKSGYPVRCVLIE